MSPQKKRFPSIAVGLLAVLFVMYLFSGKEKESAEPTDKISSSEKNVTKFKPQKEEVKTKLTFDFDSKKLISRLNQIITKANKGSGSDHKLPYFKQTDKDKNENIFGSFCAKERACILTEDKKGLLSGFNYFSSGDGTIQSGYDVMMLLLLTLRSINNDVELASNEISQLTLKMIEEISEEQKIYQYRNVEYKISRNQQVGIMLYVSPLSEIDDAS